MIKNFGVALNRFVILSLIFFTGHVYAFGFGDLVKQVTTPQSNSPSPSPKTPLENFNEATSEIERSTYTVPVTSEDSIAFKGFTAIYVGGKFEALTHSNMDEENPVVIYPLVYSNAPRKMYVKQGGHWGKADEKTFVYFVKNIMLPALDTNLLTTLLPKTGGSESPKVLVVFGNHCGHSEYMEEFLNNNKVSHLIMPEFFNSTPNESLVAMACGDASKWRNWSLGKPAGFSMCNDKANYDKFSAQAMPILYSLRGFTAHVGFPFAVFPNGEVASWIENDKASDIRFFDQLKASQNATPAFHLSSPAHDVSAKSNDRSDKIN